MAARGRLPRLSITNRYQLAIMPAACISGQPAAASALPSNAPPPPTTITAGSSGRTSAFAAGPISDS